ncbi:tetratricopeptide repeat protein [Leptospira ellisii]|uniref:Tetratricopeptide repeat protein n=1 Tax=Leptospira ellisii TaxID=2023197 RepID=A0AAE4U0J1_9LEPT|nr:tetratricopeptide repeat protein [Leptospira ellisii]MDV6236752.1 tetratricopeptide repeat protein [Leptospira ellisii]
MLPIVANQKVLLGSFFSFPKKSILFLFLLSFVQCSVYRRIFPKEDLFLKSLNLPDWVLDSSIKLRVLSGLVDLPNPEDSLPEDEIATFENRARRIFATSPRAMKDLFEATGCIDGSRLAGIRANRITEREEDVWYAICQNGKEDAIVFRLFQMGNSDLYRKYETETLPVWEEARKLAANNPDKAVRLANQVVELEPAHPGARKLLGSLYLKGGYCKGSIRNYRLYLRVMPLAGDKWKIHDQLKEKCGEFLKPEPKHEEVDLPEAEEE